jgi:serine phosphatase RsbU (regulator of sigma subunit)
MCIRDSVATYTLAGHSPPLLVHRSLSRVTRLKPPRPHAAALGVLPDEEFSGESVRLTPGDAFLFFTDGLYEASNYKGEEFGIGRLEAVLRENMYRETPELLDAAMAAISDFVEGQPIADDICIVAVDIKTDALKS